MCPLPVVDAPATVRRPIHHLGYVVSDLSRSIAHWVTVCGAGPFYVLERIDFDHCESLGKPARFDHTAAFGQCGPIAVELQQFHDVRPDPMATLLSARREEGINHVAYAVTDPAGESERLAALGFPAYMNATLGEIEVTWHDTVDMLGYSIEVHRAGPRLDDFFATIAAGATDWDGSDQVRRMP
jgi:methylmalonyl-CoA/ethylmalonyl-CoA epimerase